MLEESLLRMDLDYVDLYLIHWPLPKQDNYLEAWEALVTAKKRGLVRSIGVSNFEEEHLKRIIQRTGVTPAVNQNEIHPYWPQKELVQVNQRYGILTEAWSPLGRGSKELEDLYLQKWHKNMEKTRPKLYYVGKLSEAFFQLSRLFLLYIKAKIWTFLILL